MGRNVKDGLCGFDRGIFASNKRFNRCIKTAYHSPPTFILVIVNVTHRLLSLTHTHARVHTRCTCAMLTRVRTLRVHYSTHTCILCSRSTILVVLDKNGQKLDYEPGDHVAIYPQNSAKVVNELIDSLNPSTDPDKPIYVESRRESTGHVRWVQEKRMPVPVTLREAFTYYLDITNPPTPQMLKLLAKQATRPSEQEELNELAKGGDRYEDWKFMRFPSLADVVSQFHSLKLDATLLLQHIPLLQCVSLNLFSLSLCLPHALASL